MLSAANYFFSFPLFCITFVKFQSTRKNVFAAIILAGAERAEKRHSICEKTRRNIKLGKLRRTRTKHHYSGRLTHDRASVGERRKCYQRQTEVSFDNRSATSEQPRARAMSSANTLSCTRYV